MVFTTVLWGETKATFIPLNEALPDGMIVAALVFAMEGQQFVLADIAGRGWCIPGGRLETGETPEQAAQRETREEIGAELGSLHLLGHCIFRNATPPQSGELPDGSDNVARQSEEGNTNGRVQVEVEPGTSVPGSDENLYVRLVPMYLANVSERNSTQLQSESRGVRLVSFEDIPRCYYAWDALLEAMFAYAWAHHKAAL